MKLHLPLKLRYALLMTLPVVSLTLGSEVEATVLPGLTSGSEFVNFGIHVTTAELTESAEDTSIVSSDGSVVGQAATDESSVTWGERVVLDTPGDVTVTKTTTDVDQTDSVTVSAGSNYIVDIQNEDGKAGYGVLGNGNTVVTVIGGGYQVSDTSLGLKSFVNIAELNIDGNALVVVEPGMFMNGDMTHDIAGDEGLEKSLGVKIGTINLGNGTLEFNNGSGYLFDNADYTIGKEEGPGYTLNVTDDGARLQLGANMRTKWALIDGDSDRDGVYHSLVIGGYAREVKIAELKDLKDLSLEGGQISIDKISIDGGTGAVHGNLTVAHGVYAVINAENIMAEGSGVLNVSGHLELDDTAQTLHGNNSIVLHNGLITGANTADDLTDGLQFSFKNGTDNRVELTYSGAQNRIESDIHVDESVTFSNTSTDSNPAVRDTLTLSGYLSGDGDILIQGNGMVVMSGDSSHFTGNVEVSDGSVLSLSSKNGLVSAESLRVDADSHLWLNAAGQYPVSLNKLHLGNGSSLVMSGLTSTIQISAGDSALNIGTLSFDNGGTLNVIFSDKLSSMSVYNLFLTGNNIADTQLSQLNFKMTDSSGNYVDFVPGHYTTGYTQVEGGYLFHFETLFGNIWEAGESGTWDSTSTVWNTDGDSLLKAYDSSEYDYAIFLNQDGVAQSTVNLDGSTVGADGIYIQTAPDATSGKHTDYVFQNGSIAGGTEIHKRGDSVEIDGVQHVSSAIFSNVQGGSAENPLGWITVSGGNLILKDGSVFYFNDDKMVQGDADATLQLHDSSALIAAGSGASAKWSGAGEHAEIVGMKISGNSILGGAGTGYTSYVKNAALDGFAVQAIDLKGTGSITNGGINANVTVTEGAHYSLGGSMVMNSALKNSGTVTVDSATVFDIGGLTASGTDYTVIDGGYIEGWKALDRDNIAYNGLNFNEVNSAYVGVSTANAGKVSLNLNGVSLLTWDSRWGVDESSPRLGHNFTGTSSSAYDFSTGAYAYGSILKDGSHGSTTVVVVKGGGSTSGLLYLGGGMSWGSTGTLTQDYWLMDEGSNYQYKFGGMARTNGDGVFAYSADVSLNGDTHLQINGAGSRKDYEVYGGSYGVKQNGNAYLSINAGEYQNIYGGSRDVNLNGNVVIALNAGILNTYYNGVIYTDADTSAVENEFVGSNMGNYYRLNDLSNGNENVSQYGGIYATGSNWNGGGGAATAVLGDADIYLGRDFDFSNNLAVIDGVTNVVGGVSTLHFTDSGRYDNLNKKNIYVQIQAANGDIYLDQWSSSVSGNQPFVGKFTSISVKGFDRIELAEGAHVTLQSSNFNTDADVTISGAGTIELTKPIVWQTTSIEGVSYQYSTFDEKDSQQNKSITIPQRDIVLENRATLKVATDYLTAWNADSGYSSLTEGKSDEEKLEVSNNWSDYYDPTDNRRFDITVNTGTAVDISDWQLGTTGGSMLVDVYLAGHGTNGLGALYKGLSDADRDSSAFFQFPYIELTDDASIGIAAGATPIYMYGADDVYDNVYNGSYYEESSYLGDYNQTTLKLNEHTLTVTGGGTMTLVNTKVSSGTIFVDDGSTLRTVNTPDHRFYDAALSEDEKNRYRHITIARETDVVLSAGSALHTDLNNADETHDSALGGGLQTLKVASLSGAGDVNLTEQGLNNIDLVVVRDQFYGEFVDDNQKYWNANGYGYAYYSGVITGDGDSSVSKSGDGVQYFTGSDSMYGYTLDKGAKGGTYVSGGILYAIGTSSFHLEDGDSFVKGMTKTSKGVFGSGDIYWTSYNDGTRVHEGRVYLSDGVRIVNPGTYYENQADMPHNMILGVEAAPNGTALGEQKDGDYTFLVNDAETLVLGAINYVAVTNADITSLTGVNGRYEDGSVYTSGDTIEAGKTLYITESDWDNVKNGSLSVTVNGGETPLSAADMATEVVKVGGTEYVRIDVHNLSAINGVNGIYMDGSTYNSGDVIDRNKMLLITVADWNRVKDDASVTITGLGTAGYNEATWSGLLRNDDSDDTDQTGTPANLIKEGAGTLVLDQETTYSGTTALEGGTLRLRGWVDPDHFVKHGFTMADGTSLMLSYDGTYTEGGMDVKHYAATGEVLMQGDTCNEDHELAGNLTLVGRGDVRWNAEAATDEFTDGETAALISDVAEGVSYTISGTLSGDGNFLHSGMGTTVMVMSNDYTLGSTVTRGTVEVQTGEGLGATAEGGHANLVTWSGSHVWFNTKAATDAEKEAGLVVTTLAAYRDGADADGVPYEGNSVEGKITITSTDDLARMLHVTGNGYWAEETQLEGWNSTIVFCCEKATNTAGDAENEVLGKGAGFISGNGTIGVSDVDDNPVSLGKTMGDAFAELRDFTGSVVVEGEGAVLNMATTTSATGEGHDYIVSSGVSATEGRVTVGGQGAIFSAPDADITVAAGSTMNLTSSAYSTYDKTNGLTDSLAATVVADTVTISDGAELNVTHGEFDWSFNLEQMETQTSVALTDVLEGYQLDRGTQQALDGAVGYNYHYDKDIALNMTAAGATDVNNLTLKGGSTYRPFEANTSLNGGMLTLDVTETSKIALDISLDGELYQDDRRQQIVLFTGVDAINYLGVGEDDNKVLTIDGVHDVYYTMAENYFTSKYINPDVYLVWDSSAGVVYLDVIPEPATATLSLLALAALAARRRRK